MDDQDLLLQKLLKENNFGELSSKKEPTTQNTSQTPVTQNTSTFASQPTPENTSKKPKIVTSVSLQKQSKTHEIIYQNKKITVEQKDDGSISLHGFDAALLQNLLQEKKTSHTKIDETSIALMGMKKDVLLLHQDSEYYLQVLPNDPMHWDEEGLFPLLKTEGLKIMAAKPNNAQLHIFAIFEVPETQQSFVQRIDSNRKNSIGLYLDTNGDDVGDMLVLNDFSSFEMIDNKWQGIIGVDKHYYLLEIDHPEKAHIIALRLFNY